MVSRQRVVKERLKKISDFYRMNGLNERPKQAPPFWINLQLLKIDLLRLRLRRIEKESHIISSTRTWLKRRTPLTGTK